MVTQAAYPAILTHTLPGMLAGAMQAAGEGNTLVAGGTLPAWMAPEKQQITQRSHG